MPSIRSGSVFTWLTAVAPATPDRQGKPRTELICRCGKTVIVRNADLTRPNNSTKSCGCYSRFLTSQRNHENREAKHSRFRDLTGIKQKHGRLTAIEVVGFDKKSRHAVWLCRCECGRTTRVSRVNFLSGTTSSCGCLKRSSDANRFGTNNPHFRHGRCVEGFDRKAYNAQRRRGELP